MTVKEAAERLNVSHVSILNYINSGKLKATKNKKGLRFTWEISESDLQEFIQKYQ